MRARRTVLSGNLIVGGPEEPVYRMGGEHAQLESVNNYRTGGDPGFADYENGNFNMKPDAEVVKRIEGFEAFPFDQLGLCLDEFRTVLPE